MRTKFELNRMYRLDAIVFTHIHTQTHTHTHIHTYIHTSPPKIAQMNSEDLITYKYIKISKSNFFTIAILSLHSICSESKKGFKILGFSPPLPSICLIFFIKKINASLVHLSELNLIFLSVPLLD